MTNRKLTKLLSLVLVFMLFLSFASTSALAATKKSVYTIKVQNGILTILKNGRRLNPSYPINSQNEVSLLTVDGKLVINYTDAAGNTQSLGMGDQRLDEWRVQGNIPILTLDASLNRMKVTLDSNSNVGTLNIKHNGTVLLYGKVGKCIIDGAANVFVKNRAVVQTMQIKNSGAIVTIESRGIVKLIYTVPGAIIRNKNKFHPPVIEEASTQSYIAPPPIIPGGGGGGGGFFPPTIYVNAILVSADGGVSTVLNGSTLQMSASVLPINAANKAIAWSVFPGTGDATISSSGLLTATALGTVTVKASNAASGVTGTKEITVTDAVVTLESIAITSPAAKLVYTVGEMLDLTGLVVTGTYSDASTQVIAVMPADVTGFDSTAEAASQQLTITIGGKTASYLVEIKAAVGAATLESIAITTPATKLIYEVGETLDLTGLVVTGMYSDASTQVLAVMPTDVTGFDSTAEAASQTLTITIGGKTATFAVEIKAAAAATLESIAITTPATKLVYVIGETIDLTGLVVTGTFSDASTQVLTVMPIDVTGFDSTAEAVGQTLTITIDGKTATYVVDIIAPAALVSIAITTPATKLVYKVGEALDLTGLVVTGTYSDSSTKQETVLLADVSGFDSSAAAASQILTVTVGGETATFTISVGKADGPALSGVIANDITNTVAGMTGTMEFSTNGLDWTTYDEATPNLPDLTGTVSLLVRVAETATHEAGAFSTFNFTVPVLESIAITTPAAKLVYKVGDVLDISGLVVTGTYSDTSTKQETVLLANVSGFDSSQTAAFQVLTITIGGKTATYVVVIEKAVGPALSGVTANDITNTVAGMTGAMEFSTNGLDWTTYDEATPNLPDLTGTVSLLVRVSATVTHEAGAFSTFSFTVPTLQSIAITTPASKLTYIVSEALDLTGLVVTGTYSDTSTKQETVLPIHISGFDSSAAAAAFQVLTITIGGKTAAYVIMVEKAVGPALSGVTANDITNTVAGLAGTMEFSTNGLDWTTYDEATPNLPDLTGTVSLLVRVAETATHEAGAFSTFNFTVPVLESIAITTPAAKLAYKVGDALDISGLVVTGTYSDTSTKLETVLLANVSGFDSSAVSASQTLTVTVGGKTATYAISVDKADGPQAPPAPTLASKTDTNVTLTANGLHEFSKDAGATWQDSPSFDGLTASTTYSFVARVKATATTNASLASVGTMITTDASAAALAEIVVAAYEAAPINTLAEVALAEGLKAGAETATALVVDPALNAAFTLRIANRAAQIATTKAALQAADAAVVTLENAPLANIANLNTAEGYKNTAEAKVALLDSAARPPFTQRILVKTTAMAIANVNLQSYYGSIEAILVKYNAIFGLDFTSYNALGNKVPVQTALTIPNFITIADIKAAFDSAVVAQQAVEGSILTTFNSATTAAEIGTAITTHATSLSLILTEYNALANKTPVHTEMLGRVYTTGEEIKLAFIVAVINNSTSARVKTVLSSNAGVLGLGTNEYATLSTKSYIENAVIAAKPIADKLEIVVVAFNSTVLRGYIGQILPINKVLLGLDFTDYSALSVTKQFVVQDALVAATLTSKADIQNVFNSTVAAQKLLP